MTTSIVLSKQMESILPKWIIWVQCSAFIVLYTFWILPEIVGFRNTALVVGTLFGLYSIYLNRRALLQKSAISIWLMIALFAWATFHLIFLSSNFSLQYLEYFRIWKYGALGAIMAAGLGVSLVRSPSNQYWYAIYFGLCTPVITYLLKYGLTAYGQIYGLDIPISLQVNDSLQPFYVPKTNYVAFCLPAFSIALGSLIELFSIKGPWHLKNFLNLITQILVIGATLFLFSAENIKNGMAYAVILVAIFGVLFFSSQTSSLTWKKIIALLIILTALTTAVVFNLKKNDSWRTLVADAKIAVQLDKYPHWKDLVKYRYPLNEYGTIVSWTNYERVAYAYAGVKLAIENPLGYGLVEDSFAKMAKAHWPDVGPNLSHSHSGWIDIILAIGFPGFLLILGALFLVLKNSYSLKKEVWKMLAFWPLLANLLLWCTTEVSASVTFAALIFWICLGGGLILGSSTKTTEQKVVV